MRLGYRQCLDIARDVFLLAFLFLGVPYACSELMARWMGA